MAGLVALEKMVMLVLLMLVGFVAAKAKWVDSAFSQRASHLVANVFIVATILSSVVGVEPQMAGKELLVVVVSVFFVFGVGGVLGFVVSRLLPLPQQDRTVAWLSVFFMNNVFIGFPVVEALFGQSAVFCASLSNLPFNLLLFSIGVSRLRAGQGRGRVTLREVLSPALVGTLAAIVLFLFQIPLPSLVADTIRTLGGATVPLSMLIIGISLSQVPVAQALRDWRAYGVSLVRLIVCPVVVWLVLRLFLEGTTLGVLTVIAACPSGAMITILCLRYGLDDTFASRVNFLSTILCAVTLPVMTSLLL
ncbi:MAG: AEC family transporter [Clostridiales bacterium]|nr:AEC family transporter [Clostridiales bacterium]